MSNPYVTGMTDSVDTSMELGVPAMLQPWFHSANSQTGKALKMKGMMKSASDNLDKFERIKHEERRLELQIIKEMNTMELFYREHPFSDINRKPHLEREVTDLYYQNKKRIEIDGIGMKNLTKFMKNSDRTESENRKKYQNDIARREPVSKDEYEVKNATANSHSDSKRNKDPVLNRYGYETRDGSDEDYSKKDDYFDRKDTDHNDYMHQRGSGLDGLYLYHI